ncbi:hypothetical protein [Tuberibacillus sp. Marseille-P3662]|uniref:hypothetical protein n=1 Tax=Tuberibacillus sp. Marseille-P3662 TaxID=1965358 RepID=UPI000A1CB0A8|nr:hypothetical protein [Tuberibacillus sp. Marseille-P3662]
MWKRGLMITCLFVVLTALSACSPSKDEAWNEAVSNVKEVLEEAPKDTNKDRENFSYYKPETFSITEKTQSNIVFEYDDQTYILFVNPNENRESRLGYQSVKQKMDKADRLQAIETGDDFGYININMEKDKRPELIVSTGGVKMTTRTDLDHLAEDAKTMMKVVHSIQLK